MGLDGSSHVVVMRRVRVVTDLIVAQSKRDR